MREAANGIPEKVCSEVRARFDPALARYEYADVRMKGVGRLS